MDQLFTAAGLGTLGGATVAAWVVPAGIGFLVGPGFTATYKKWVCFLMAMAIAYLGAALADVGPEKWFLALLNGFLIFLAAYGINMLTARDKQPGTAAMAGGPKFLRSWA